MKNPAGSDQVDLNDAIGRVSQNVLAKLVKEICETNESVRELVQSRLFVDVNEVSNPSDEDESDEDKPAKPTPDTAGSKRQRVRFAHCENCKKEFDVSTNAAESCSYHPSMKEPNECCCGIAAQFDH